MTIAPSHPSPAQRISKIAEFVKKHLFAKAAEFPSEYHNPVYRWEHTLRVAQWGKQLAEAEGANVEIVVAGSLLHDIAHFESDDDYKDHGRRGARIIRPFLEDLSYTSEQVDNLCFAVAYHVDDDAGFDHPKTIEAQCVTDADNLDRFGVYRILQWCVPEMDDFPRLIEKLGQRVEQLRGYRARDKVLETTNGNRLFRDQLDRQIAFFQGLIDEYGATVMPEL